MWQEYLYNSPAGYFLQAPRIMESYRLSLSKPEASSGQVVLTAIGLPSNTLATSAAAPAVSEVKFAPTAIGSSGEAFARKPLAYIPLSRSARHTNQPLRSRRSVSRTNAHLVSRASLLSPPLLLVFVGALRYADILGLLISQYSAVIGRHSNPAPLPLEYCEVVSLGLILYYLTPADTFKTIKSNLPLVLPKYYFIIVHLIYKIMAKIKTSAIVADIRGTLGGNVFSSNKGGNYVRRYKKPTNTNTIPQQIMRALFMALSTSWRALADASRAAWIAIAPHYPYMDSLGETKILSGQQLFMKLNQNINGYNSNYPITTFALLDMPVTPQVFPTISFASGVCNNTTSEIELTNILIDGDASVPTGFGLVFEACQVLSQGISAPQKGLFKSLLSYSPSTDFTDSVNASDLYLAYVYKYGMPHTGSGFYGNIYLVCVESGEKSVPIRAWYQVTV